MEIVREQDQAYRGGKSGVKYLVRGPNIDWGVILFAPGDELGRHLHREVEETFYFVEGREGDSSSTTPSIPLPPAPPFASSPARSTTS